MIRNFNKWPGGYEARAFVESAAEETEEAVYDLNKSIELSKRVGETHAVCFIRLNQLHSALDDLERSYKINPRSAVTMAYLASVEEKLGRKADAEKHISDALAKSQVPIVLANAAEVRLHQGDAQQALKLADDALKGDPYLREGFEIRAQVLKKLGREADATRDQQRRRSWYCI